MSKSVIHGVGEELRELGKDTVKEIAQQAEIAGKEFFKSLIGYDEIEKLSDDELEKKKKQEEKEKEALLHQQRVMLKMLAAAHPRETESTYEQTMKDDQGRAQRQVELEKQKMKMALPRTGAKPKRGNLYAFRKRKEAHVEVGRIPGQ